jgi:hypothetical protein
MSFTTTLTLDDASGDAVAYTTVSNGVDGVKRLDVASTLAAPGIMQIKHSVNGSGANAIDRHLVQFSRTADSSGVPRTAVVNLTLAIPRDAVITNGMVADLVSNLIDFIADGTFGDSGIGGVTNLTALLRGES